MSRGGGDPAVPAAVRRAGCGRPVAYPAAQERGGQQEGRGVQEQRVSGAEDGDGRSSTEETGGERDPEGGAGDTDRPGVGVVVREDVPQERRSGGGEGCDEHRGG